MENIVIHKADTRGSVDMGWLKSRQTFSFSGYYNPERIQFGALRVLNDDVVAGGRGFGNHPHDNMEIISIPLKGGLVHMDSMGNSSIIHPGEIQVMSAGTGIYHTEYNQNDESTAEFLQIWVFPNKRNVTPRYDQQQITLAGKNVFTQILSPNGDDEGVWIYQNAWFHMGEFDGGNQTVYDLKDKTNGVYVFVIKGDITVNGQALNNRDGMGIINTQSLNITADSDAQILLMEVPSTFNG
jgi:redox-sensitive bicupin YhaK (pirin superfamily)